MERHSDGFSIDESPEASILLDREWSLQAVWVTAYLEDHPSATAKQIERSVSDLGVNLQCNATLLAQSLYGVAIQKGEVGNVFVIAENHKHHRLVWNAKDLKPGTTRNSKLLAAWSARAAKTKANAEVLRPFDAPDASSKIRAEQTGISRFVCQATDGASLPFNRARRQLP